MARFWGTLGFVDEKETAPGVWTTVVDEREYKGNVIQDTRRWRESGNLNDDLLMENSISIVADPHAYQNLFAIKFVRWMGVAWRVKSIDVKRPRLILYIGGVYNDG